MRVLVVGSGGREHALCWAISSSPLCDALFCAPGNPGIADEAACVDIAATDNDGILKLCKKEKIDFVVIGPETPLVGGLVDKLEAAGIAAFGPTAKAAALEGSKGFAKDLCAKYGIPSPAYKRFSDADAAKDYVRKHKAPIVVKADGLAAGKGVTVAATTRQAISAIDAAMVAKKFGAAGAEVVLEDCLEGEEISFFALVDGKHALALASDRMFGWHELDATPVRIRHTGGGQLRIQVRLEVIASNVVVGGSAAQGQGIANVSKPNAIVIGPFGKVLDLGKTLIRARIVPHLPGRAVVGDGALDVCWHIPSPVATA